MKWINTFRTCCHRLKFPVAIIFIGILCAAPAQAYNLPAVNLGLTSFLDGGPPAGPGYYFQEYIQYFRSQEFKNAEGKSLLPEAANEDLSIWAFLSQLIYVSNHDLILGGKWGFNLIAPVVFPDVDYDLNLGFPEANSAGLGDVIAGPFLQWDPIMGSRGPIFMHRIAFDFIIPAGKYDENKEINPGNNYFSFNPYWAGTFFLTPRWTASWRLHYLWNAKNDDPNRAFVGADDTQAGQAIHLNFASAYEILPQRLRVGINGYFLKQITDFKVDGVDVPDTRELVLGIGPGAVFHFSKDNHLFFNAYFETETENRPQGHRMIFRWTHHF